MEADQKKRIRGEIRKVARTTVVAIVFVVVFLFALVAKRKIHAAPIIFYEGIGIIAVLGAVAIAAAFLLDLRRPKSQAFSSHVLSGIFLGMVTAYAFHITLPSLLDRSISMFVLSLLRETSLSPAEVQCNFVEQFVIDSGALDKRVKEQVATGNIQAQGGQLSMTSRGRFMDSSWIFMADAFAVRKDFVEVRPAPQCDGSHDGEPAGVKR
jgi:hypothetical protein